jgi:imidazolonepropionase-like amidohydrolase
MVPSIALIIGLIAAQSTAQTWVIADITVIDPRSGRITEHSSIVVNGAKIAAIQPADAPIPRGAHRIDAKDLIRNNLIIE